MFKEQRCNCCHPDVYRPVMMSALVLPVVSDSCLLLPIWLWCCATCSMHSQSDIQVEKKLEAEDVDSYPNSLS